MNQDFTGTVSTILFSISAYDSDDQNAIVKALVDGVIEARNNNIANNQKMIDDTKQSVIKLSQMLYPSQVLTPAPQQPNLPAPTETTEAAAAQIINATTASYKKFNPVMGFLAELPGSSTT